MCPRFESRWYHQSKAAHVAAFVLPTFIAMLQSTVKQWLRTLEELKPDVIVWIREVDLDEKLCQEYREVFSSFHGVELSEAAVKGGERLKEWGNLIQLFDSFSTFGVTKHSLVVTTGGGALSDAVGFVASTWKRGVPIVHMPTTTLACIDAAWGGKTAVNWGGAKNQIGTIVDPEAIHVDSKWLSTLSVREFRAGLAEGVKHALIASPGEFDFFSIPALSISDPRADSEAWDKWLLSAAQVKAQIVKVDPYDQGPRIQLNLGHTVAHAVEAHFATTSTPWLHGEAVALGLQFSMFESRTGTLCPRNDSIFDSFISQLELWLETNIPWPSSELPEADALWTWMTKDKKNKHNQVMDIAWRGQGALKWPVEWKEETFEATWHAFLRSKDNSLSPST